MAGVFAALRWQLLLQGESHTKDRLGTVVVVGRVFGRGDFGCNREATLASKRRATNSFLARGGFRGGVHAVLRNFVDTACRRLLVYPVKMIERARSLADGVSFFDCLR